MVRRCLHAVAPSILLIVSAPIAIPRFATIAFGGLHITLQGRCDHIREIPACIDSNRWSLPALATGSVVTVPMIAPAIGPGRTERPHPAFNDRGSPPCTIREPREPDRGDRFGRSRPVLLVYTPLPFYSSQRPERPTTDLPRGSALRSALE
jgi:hypothetical protein